jgi:hypothetical protein
MGKAGALWGVGGILFIVGYAVVRLAHPSVEAFSHELRWFHWLLLMGNTAFVVYAKAYRGFQKGLSPRIAARARSLRDEPTSLRVALAPLFCLGYFQIARRRQISMIAITISMVALIFLVRLLGQPWRGIIDTGIVVGLTWGFATIAVYSAKALTSETFAGSPLVPRD